MTSSDSERTTSSTEKTSSGAATRRGRVPGPESGFGQRLREARGIKKQAEVAERAEIARSALARYESGDRFPSVPELRRLCEALGVSPEYLIYGDAPTGFTPTKSPIAAIVPDGESEADRMVRHVLTGVLINVMPKNEADAIRELVWASVSHRLKDQPELLNVFEEITKHLIGTISEDIEQLVETKFESDPKLREIVQTLPDDENDD